MSMILWPRQEVLQLVIPQLGSVGRNLNANTAINVIRKLTKMQTTDGKIRWLVVSKDVLRWNDHCIRLFWEMLTLSTYYIHRDIAPMNITGKQEMSLELQYIAIFLILHLHDDTSTAQPNSPSSPSSSGGAYEDVWPTISSPIEEEVINSSPVTSPTKESINNRNRIKNNSSPRSASGVPSNSTNSPTFTRSSVPNTSATTSRNIKSNAQYLHSVKQKIPLIIRALSLDQQEDMEAVLTDLTLSVDITNDYSSSSSASENAYRFESYNNVTEFTVNKKTVDALGFIVCGGLSRDQSVPHLSSLFAPFQTPTIDNSDELMRASRDLDDVFSDRSNTSIISFSELLALINLHISMNDTLYPISATSNYSSNSNGINISELDSLKDSTAMNNIPSNKAQQPVRISHLLPTLSRSIPTVINGCTTTVIHVINSISGSLSRPSSFRKNSNRSITSSRSSGSVDFEHMHKNTSDSNAQISPRVTPSSHSFSTNDIISPTKQNHLPRTLSKTSSFRLEGNANHSTSMDEINTSSHIPRTEYISHSQMDMLDPSAESELYNMLSKNDRSEFILPPIYLNSCVNARLYLLSPYHSASIKNCSDSDIVIGAVYGAVTISNCESLRVSVACRKLLIFNCVNCVFNLATLTTTIIAGDSKGVIIGPYNTSYKNLRNHLMVAGLQPLLSSDEPTSARSPLVTATTTTTVDPIITSDDKFNIHSNINNTYHNSVTNPNCWASICDITACLEAPPTNGSPSGYALDAIDITSNPSELGLTPPLPSTARLLHYEDFQIITIPYKNETLSFDKCPIKTPKEYQDSLQNQQETIDGIRNQLASIINNSSLQNANGNISQEERKKKQDMANAAISKKFMEWLVSSGNAKQVLDLIRIDGEKFGLSTTHHSNNNIKNNNTSPNNNNNNNNVVS